MPPSLLTCPSDSQEHEVLEYKKWKDIQVQLLSHLYFIVEKNELKGGEIVQEGRAEELGRPIPVSMLFIIKCFFLSKYNGVKLKVLFLLKSTAK